LEAKALKEVELPQSELPLETATFVACLATILELSFDELPRPAAGEDPATGWTLSRWLGGLGLGLAAVADPGSFSWAGPWIARIRGRGAARSRFVVMYGVPSGVVWDPADDGALEESSIEDGFLVAAADVALALPPRPPAPASAGRLEEICVASSAGEPVQTLRTVRAIAGRGLEGDRHVSGRGTFPSGPPGSALTMIAAEVCESFEPPLTAEEHRRNLVTRGIDLNRLVGRDFTIGKLQCRGMRLCEPCTVVQRYDGRPVLRELVHRGGLRVDILKDGVIAVGDEVRAIGLD
jgi:MOSC domain-containing protein YiiM